MAPPRVLLCTSNGAGLGHVTRMMAVAEQLGPAIDTTLFTLSAALPVPVMAGLRVEHLPSAGYLDIPPGDWHELLEDRVDHLLSHYRPDVVLFDGVHPYRGLTNALHRRRRRLTRVWLRRGMWRAGVGAHALALASHFDHVIEPGEYATAYDVGAPSTVRAQSHCVAPVCYLGSDDIPDRAAACAELGLDPEGTNVLIQLGAGTINDLTSTLGAAVAELERHDARVCLGQSVLSSDLSAPPGNVMVVRRFPISRLFAAFDFGMIATGYNSFHEALSIGLPTIMVPNLNTKTDDQDARSRWADDAGLAIRWDGSDLAQLRTAVESMMSISSRSEIREKLSRLDPASGAIDVARLVSAWAA